MALMASWPHVGAPRLAVSAAAPNLHLFPPQKADGNPHMGTSLAVLETNVAGR
jgi:hypothetical protein